MSREFIHRREMPLANHQRFKGPDSPVRNEHQERFILAHDALVSPLLDLQIVAEQARLLRVATFQRSRVPSFHFVA